MKLRPVPAPTLSAVCTLLAPHCADITETRLVQALRGFEEGDRPTAPRRISPRRFAELNDISVFTVKRMIAEGTLPAVKMRGQWRIAVGDV